MKWFIKAFNYGIGYFAVMFLISSIFMMPLKLEGDSYRLCFLLASIIVLGAISHQFNFKNQIDGLITGAIWLGVDVVLELLLIGLLFNKGNLNFYSWANLINYVLILFVPTLIGSRALE
jgi:hypothetical protein